MSIRIRTVNGLTVALCAAETEAEPGDVYLDDPQHYALAAKFAKDWQGQTVDWEYPKQWRVMEGQRGKTRQNEAMDCGHARKFAAFPNPEGVECHECERIAKLESNLQTSEAALQEQLEHAHAAAERILAMDEQLRAADAVLEAMKPNSLCPHDEEPDYCVCCETDRDKRIAEAAKAYLALRRQREEIPYGQ